MHDLIAITVRNRLDRLIDEVVTPSSLSKLLYGDSRQLTRNERFVRRFNIYRNRISDAWLVLTGRADIGDY